MIRRRVTAQAAFAALIAASLFVPARAALAVTIDGQLDAEYGSALVTQTTQTGLNSGQITGDSNVGDLNFANGSELDAAHALVTGGALDLFLAGNLALVLNVNQNRTIGHVLDLFVDSGPGGQNTLGGLGAGHPLNGLTFDAGFEADHWFEFRGDGNQFSVEWWVGSAVLSSGGGATITNLGRGSAGGPGTLTGGTNPLGIRATIDNRNSAGVTLGCAASSGAGVTRGIEWNIPLAAIGNPEGCFRIAVIVRDGSPTQAPVSNQVLAPVPPGTCPLGHASTVNFANIPGDQFLAVCPGATDVAPASPTGLNLSLAGPNPGRGDRVPFAFALPDTRPAALHLFDCTGRVVRARAVDAEAGAGVSGTLDLSEGRSLPPGLYWARLSHGGSSVVRRFCVVK